MTIFGVVLFIVIACLIFYFGLSPSKDNEDSAPSGGGSSSGASYFNKGGHNNPGYLIHTNTQWKGKENSDYCKFENFATLTWGVRAWYVNLFGKVKNGTITNTNQMIDILTPAGKENSEVARNNYKASVARATNWLDLGIAVFNFEANPDWLNSSSRTDALEQGFADAVQYRFNGVVPPYFK